MAAGVLERHASVDGSSAGTARAPAAGLGPTSLGGVVAVEPDRVTPIRGAVARGRLLDHRQQPLGRGELPAAQRPQSRRDLGRQRVALPIERADDARVPSLALLAHRFAVHDHDATLGVALDEIERADQRAVEYFTGVEIDQRHVERLPDADDLGPGLLVPAQSST